MSLEHVAIPRSEALTRGTWRMSLQGQPVHRCPSCGVASEMANHAVAVDGMVTPSIACFPPCGYHVMGKLDGWRYGNKPAGQAVHL